MKELNLLFPTIPNFLIVDRKKSGNNRFENTWVHIDPVYSLGIFESIVPTSIQLFHVEVTKKIGLRVVAPLSST